MGCDIHIVVERRKKESGQWIGAYCTDFLPRSAIPIAQRDYDFFAEIANVRGTTKSGNYPKNLPEDISDLAWQQYMTAPTDHHSASYMPCDDMVKCWLKVNGDRPEQFRHSQVREQFALNDLFGYIDAADEGTEWEFRAVFWFDN